MQERVYMSATPAAVTSDLKQRLIDTWASISQNVIDKAVGQWKKQLHASTKAIDITLNICYTKTCSFQSRHNRFFSEPLTIYWGKHVVSRHFYRSHLKANKVSKSEGTRKFKYAYYFWKCADAVDRKLSKLVHVYRSYSLPKLARYFET